MNYELNFVSLRHETYDYEEDNSFLFTYASAFADLMQTAL